MSAHLPPLSVVEDVLEQASKYRWTDFCPLEVSAPKKRRAECAREGRDAKPFAEEAAVDIGKRRKVLVQVFLSFLLRSVKDVEEFGKGAAQIGSILTGPLD